MIEHKTIEPETKTAIVMSRDAIDALRRVVDLIAGGEGVIRLEPEPEPEPDPWPDAPLIVATCEDDRHLFVRASDGDYAPARGRCQCGFYYHGKAGPHLSDAVPVTLVPTEAWEAWLDALPDPTSDADDDFVQAVNTLTQEVAR